MMYKLVNHKPVLVKDTIEWAKRFEDADRVVNRTELLSDGIIRKEDISISTVFLGLDHSFDGKIPLLFETMIFGGEHDQYQERYATWEEAEKGHIEAVKLAKL